MDPSVSMDDWHIHDPSRLVTIVELVQQNFIIRMVKVGDMMMIGVTGKAQEDGYR